MNELISILPTWLASILVVFAFALAIAWLLLPVAVFGLKPLVKSLIREQARTNELLARTAGAPQTPDGSKGVERVYAEPDRPVRFAGSANLPPT